MSIQGEFLVIDTETTNLSEFREIVELAICLYEIEPYGKGIQYTFKDKFVSKMCPERPCSKEAMGVNSMSDSEVFSAPQPIAVRSELISWWAESLDAKRFTIIGHNYGNFDSILMRKFLSVSYDEMFDYHSLDTWNLAYLAESMGLINVESLSLSDLCENLNIPHWQHRADGDCKATMELFKTLYNRIARS